jgi:hypothetical protein
VKGHALHPHRFCFELDQHDCCRFFFSSFPLTRNPQKEEEEEKDKEENKEEENEEEE